MPNYKIKYDKKLKPNGKDYFKVPLTEAQLREKYTDDKDFNQVINFPNTQEMLVDRFGEEFLYLSNKEIEERYGEDILDIFEELVDNSLVDIPVLEEEENQINTTDRFEDNTYNNEKQVNTSAYFLKDFISESGDNESEKDEEINEERDDGEVAEAIYDDAKVFMDYQMKVGYRALYNPANYTKMPSTIRFEDGHQMDLYDALDDYQTKHNTEFKLDAEHRVMYESILEPYQKGRFPEEDEKRLTYLANSIAVIKEEHDKHGFLYMLAHPINYFKEFWNMHKINKLLKDNGFNQEEIDNKVNQEYSNLTQENRIKETNLEEDKERVFENDELFKDNSMKKDMINNEKDIQIEVKMDEPVNNK